MSSDESVLCNFSLSCPGNPLPRAVYLAIHQPCLHQPHPHSITSDFHFRICDFQTAGSNEIFFICDTPAARLNLPHSHIRFSHLHLQPRLFSNYVYLAIHQQPVYTKGVRLTLDPSFQTFTFAFVTIIGNDYWTFEIRHFFKMSHSTITIIFFHSMLWSSHEPNKLIHIGTKSYIFWPTLSSKRR